jgi:hypothetical protein
MQSHDICGYDNIEGSDSGNVKMNVTRNQTQFDSLTLKSQHESRS